MSLLFFFPLTGSAPVGNPNAFVDLTTAWWLHYLTALATAGYTDVTTTVAAEVPTARADNPADLNSGFAADFVTNG